MGHIRTHKDTYKDTYMGHIRTHIWDQRGIKTGDRAGVGINAAQLHCRLQVPHSDVPFPAVCVCVCIGLPPYSQV